MTAPGRAGGAARPGRHRHRRGCLPRPGWTADERCAELAWRGGWWRDAATDRRPGRGGPSWSGPSSTPRPGSSRSSAGYIWTTCASVENGNPLFWDDEVAGPLTGGPIAPPTMLSVWFRPHHWAPGRAEAALPLQVHFDLKALLGPARGGDDRQHHHLLRPGPARGPAAHPPGTALGQRREDDQARHRALLGDRGESTATRTASWWGWSPTPASATGGSRERHRPPHLLLRRRVGRRPPAPAALRRHRHHRGARGPGQPRTGGPCTTTRTSPSTATGPGTSS